MLMLRALEIGLKISELEEITVGELLDMLIEKGNDQYEYPIKATREDFARF